MVQRFDKLTGKVAWCVQGDDYDYVQEISRSDYGDMLWDRERNQLYNKAISKAVRYLIKTNPNNRHKILDIGTGTGLLSMMVCREFEKHGLLHSIEIKAFEAFRPIAECARKVIKRNGYENQIEVINERSDKYLFPDQWKADLLVTEVFDTELIGEGAVNVFRFALEHQLRPGALIVPSKATVWLQLFTSKWIHQSQQFTEMRSIRLPHIVENCEGATHLHDVQLSQLKKDNDFRLLTHPKIGFQFDFTDGESMKIEENKEVVFQLIDNCDDEKIGVFFWWTLDMDYEGEIVLSCAPKWAHAEPKNIPWRDHWMQAIYFLPINESTVDASKGEQFALIAHHDQYSFWFTRTLLDQEPPFCSCQIHQNLSPLRLRMMNDHVMITKMMTKFDQLTLQKQIKNVLFIGDASFLPVLAAQQSKIDYITCLTNDYRVNIEFFNIFPLSNNCKDKFKLYNFIEQLDGKFDAVLSEPYFQSISPWNIIHFWYIINQLRERGLISADTPILPGSARMQMLPVEFDDLWKIHAKLGSDIENFDVTDFDAIIDKAASQVDANVQSQPLWEYPCRKLTNQSFEIFNFDFTKDISSTLRFTSRHRFKVGSDIRALTNICLAFWIEFIQDGDIWYGTGAEDFDSCGIDDYVKWNRCCKQGVAFLQPNLIPGRYYGGVEGTVGFYDVEFDVVFSGLEGNLDFHCIQIAKCD